MGIVVSKADALVEMVKAYDNQQIKKANKIGQMLCKSIQNDNRENIYTSYIGLDRETKQFFSTKVRKKLQKVKAENCDSGVEIIIGNIKYELTVQDDTITIKEKE